MAPQYIPNTRNYPFYVYINIIISLAHCVLSKALNTCLQPLTTKQMIYLDRIVREETKRRTVSGEELRPSEEAKAMALG